MGGHIALLGDSIFDNRAYTGTEPDVLAHLRAMLAPGWRASLLAVDGSATGDLQYQLPKISADVTHLVISLGGNDAIANSDLLATPVTSTGVALALFAERIGHFEASYRQAIDAALALGRDVTTCTIYEGNLEPEQGALIRIGLMLFNDIVLRVAFERRLAVIDLRLVCNTPEDYANPIEPSGTGGRKIAQAIARRFGFVPPAGPPAAVHGA
jgi:hypothetical protein